MSGWANRDNEPLSKGEKAFGALIGALTLVGVLLALLNLLGFAFR